MIDLKLTAATTDDLHEIWKAFTPNDVLQLWPQRLAAVTVNDLLDLVGSMHVAKDADGRVIATLQIGLDAFGKWVRSDHRRRGVATRLVNALINRDPHTPWFVWGRVENKAGRRLFAGLGFQHWRDDGKIFQCRHDPAGALSQLLDAMTGCLPKQ